jgi:hypothetical protein
MYALIIRNGGETYIGLPDVPEETDRIVIKFVRETKSSIDILEERSYSIETGKEKVS